MAVTGRMIARALTRANVASSKQADLIAADLDTAGEADPHAPLHQSVAALWDRVNALEAELAKRKPGPKPKTAEATT